MSTPPVASVFETCVEFGGVNAVMRALRSPPPPGFWVGVAWAWSVGSPPGDSPPPVPWVAVAAALDAWFPPHAASVVSETRSAPTNRDRTDRTVHLPPWCGGREGSAHGA